MDYNIENFETERRTALNALQGIYPSFLRHLIRDHSWIPQRQSPRWMRTLQNLRERYGGGERNLSFAVIDGTCDKKLLSEMMIFYSASYAQQGELIVNPNNEYLEYRRWLPNQDTSLVAYLPVPLSRLELFEDDEWLFRTDNADRSTAMMIHTSLMQLAEIFLACRRATEDSPPRIILLDNSLSSMLPSNDIMHLIKPYERNQPVLGWIESQIDVWGRQFEPADALVAHAHPMEATIGVPSWRLNALAECVVARLTDFWQIGAIGERDQGRPLPLKTVIEEASFNTPLEAVRERLSRMGKLYMAFTVRDGLTSPIRDFSEDSYVFLADTP